MLCEQLMEQEPPACQLDHVGCTAGQVVGITVLGNCQQQPLFFQQIACHTSPMILGIEAGHNQHPNRQFTRFLIELNGARSTYGGCLPLQCGCIAWKVCPYLQTVL
jgi:hypothetical protein